MICDDDCGMCGICSKARTREIELEKRCDYRLEMEYDNKPLDWGTHEEQEND